MVDNRSSLRNGAARLGAVSDLDYCRRLSAYLGLSLETVISLTRQGASGVRATGRNRPAK